MTAISAPPAPPRTADTPSPTPRRRTLGAVLRSVLFWIHFAVGITGGLVILLMSVTGVLLGYERQMIAWLDGAPKVAAPTAAAWQPLDQLISQSSTPRSGLAGLTINRDETVPLTLRLRDRSVRLVNPYTGAMLETPAEGRTRKFMTWLRGWHRWLGTKAGEARDQARAVTGAFNLAFLFLVLSGLYLWWPRRWSFAAVKNILLFRSGLSSKARDFNWHHVIGFWSAVPLAVIIITGAFISYRWPGQWLDRLLGNEKEKAAAIEAMRAPAPSPTPPAATKPPASDAPMAEPVWANLDLVVSQATTQDPTWKTIALTFPEGQDSVIRVAIAAGNTYRPDLRTQMTVAAASGEVLSVATYDSLSPARKLRSWVRFGHTGEVFGWFGQTVATLVTLGAVVLVWTGFALGFRRIGGKFSSPAN